MPMNSLLERKPIRGWTLRLVVALVETNEGIRSFKSILNSYLTIFLKYREQNYFLLPYQNTPNDVAED
jgi:hypothetical protein